MMQKCENCSAEFDEKLMICPYCGYEVHAMAVDAHEGKIERMSRVSQSYEQAPGRTLKKGTRAILWGALIFLLASALIAGLVALISYVNNRRSIPVLQAHIAAMEEYYAAGDYEGMADYLKSLDNYFYSSYDKYYTAMRWDEQASRLEEYSGSIAQSAVSPYADQDDVIGYIIDTLESGCETLTEIGEAETRGWLLDEEVVGNYCRNRIIRIYEDVYKMSDEEIITCMNMYKTAGDTDLQPDYTEMAEAVYERLRGE